MGSGCGEYGGDVHGGGGLLQDAEEVFGANRWDAAEFDDENEKQKFIKLMVTAPSSQTSSTSRAWADMTFG